MDDLISAINKQIRSNASASKVLAELSILREKAIDEIANAKWEIRNSYEVITTKNTSDATSDQALAIALEDTIAQAPLIYANIVREAVATNDEFSFNAFLRPLLEVGDNSDLYDIRVRGSGWNRTILVNLRMNEVAGNIDDYANAVEIVRSEFETKGNRKRNPANASRMWRYLYSNRDGGSGEYYSTINDRMYNVESLAPFWSLLDSGNKISMSSNWGGTAYPNMPGTHFVDDIESKIKNLFDSTFLRIRANGITTYNTETIKIDRKDLEARIKELEYAISDLDTHVVQLENNMDDPDVYIEKLGVDKEKVSTAKVVKAAAKLKQGVELSKNVEIGKPGQRKRMSRAKFERLLGSMDE